MGKRSRDSVLLLADSLSRMGAGFVVSVLIARFYGPEGLGVITTGTAWVTIVLGFSALGLSGVLVKEMVAKPDERGALIFTVTLAKLAAGLVLLALLLLAILGFEDDPTLFRVILIMGAGYVFACFDTVECLYNAQERFQRLVALRMSALAISTAMKVSAIAFDWGLEYVALGYAMDYALVYLLPAIDFLFSRSKEASDGEYAFRMQLPLLASLLKRSWPVLISGGFAQLNLKIDAILIASLAGIASVGYYSAATRLSEAWSVLAMSIVTATFPGLVKVSRIDHRKYGRDLSKLMRILLWVSLAGAAVVALTAQWIIHLLYGVEYAASAGILAIHIFGGVFLFIRTAVSRWLIIEDLLKLSLVSHALGAAVNIGLNLFLIPAWGITGAAWASVVSYATSAFLFLLVVPRSRHMFNLILWSFLPPKIADPRVEEIARKMMIGRKNEV